MSTDAGDNDEPGEPCLAVAAVARRLGVAPATLRTWDRRYGVGPTQHAAGERRRYAPADLARLELMRGLVLAGVPPAEAARVAVDRLPAPDEPPPDDQLPSDGSAGGGAVPAEPGPAGPAGSARHAGPACRPGGRILAIPGASVQVRGLARAAMALDAAATRAAVETAVRSDGVVAAWDSLLRPVLVAIGDRWRLTGKGVEVEHLLTETAIGVLRTGAPAPEPGNGRPVLLACAPGDQHCLPLSALAAGLAEHGIGVRLLGGGLPAEALAAAVRRTGPAVVLVFAQRPDAADARVLDSLPSLRPQVAVLAGGAGWAYPLPTRARYVPDLRAAVDAIRHVVGGQARASRRRPAG